MRVVFKVRGGRGGGCRGLVSSSSTRKSGYHLTSNKNTCPTDFITFPQVPRTARAEATSFVRETRAKVGDLKGRPSHVTVRLRVLVQKHKSASRHWRLATCYYDLITRASQLASSHTNHRALKFPSFFDAPFKPFPARRAFGFAMALSFSHHSGGRWFFCSAERHRNRLFGFLISRSPP